MHTPVLLDEVMEVLEPAPGEIFVDGTVGAGGHSRKILQRIGESGLLIAFDWDEKAVDAARENLLGHSNVLFYRENFTGIPERIRLLGCEGTVNGVLLDLGLSSMQLADPERGFSFKGGILDMRMDRRLPENAFLLLSRLNVIELEKILRTYGEEPEARRVADAVISAWRKEPIRTADQLAEVVAKAKRKKTRHHPATQTFQALRIAVNRELDNLASALRTIPRILAPGGRFAVISFHSLEDRMVKNAFREIAGKGKDFVSLTRKPITPGEAEVARNPRARSAKLRAVRLREQD